MKTLSAVLVYLIVLKTSSVFCSNVACVQECDTNTTGLFDCSNRQCSLLPLPPLAAEYKFTTILLNNNELTDINSQLNAESIYPDADFIDFSFNRINYIFKNVFDDLMSLRTLNLSNNLLNVFDFGLFDSTKNIEKVNLKSNSIKTLHGSSYVIYVKHLDLSDNLLRSLDKAFTYCLSLTHLNLSRNQIEAIEKDDFDQLALLEVLDLYDNEIKEISDKALDSLSHLQLLDLRNNYINTLTADTFNQLSALSTLLLSENRLKAVSTAVFSPLYRLCYLHIEMNPLEIIEVEGDLPGSLQEIRLAYTNLKVISNGTLANLAYLNDVVISNNDQLTMIDTGVFSGQTFYAVRRLSIANNALKSLSSDLLDWNLVDQVDASGNHWACNCSMGWIKSSNIANVSGNTFKCSSPEVFKNKDLLSLQNSQLKCGWSPSWRDRMSRRMGVWLIMISTITFLATVTYMVYKNRRRLLPCAYRNADKYSSLYNAADMDDSRVTLHPSNHSQTANAKTAADV